MVFDYFSFARAKKNQEALEKTNPQDPVLNHEDEQFLEKVATHDMPAAPLPPTVIHDDGSEQLAQSEELKEAAETAGTVALPAPTDEEASKLAAGDNAQSQKRTWSSYVPSVPSMPSLAWRSKTPQKTNDKSSDDQAKTDSSVVNTSEKATEAAGANDAQADEASGAAPPEETTSGAKLDADKTSETPAKKVDEKLDAPVESKPEAKAESAYPPGVKVTENVKLDQTKREEDEKEVSVLLDRLNLSSINNRVFSFSKQSQKLYAEFTVVLKDVINGGPTAYEDMEKLLRDNDAHLREMFNNMPPFVQSLVKSLPAKFGSSLGPEVLAAASEKPGADLKARMAAASQPPSAQQKKKKQNVPNVKGLTNEKGAVAGMLRSIVTFLKTRFPAFVTGTNVIMSLAVFILLFVFWYCHKRGKETRLLKEANAASASASVSEGSDVESGLDESQDLSPHATEKVDEKISSDPTPPTETDSTKVTQDILNQPEPAEVPLPSKEEEKDLETTDTKAA